MKSSYAQTTQGRCYATSLFPISYIRQETLLNSNIIMLLFTRLFHELYRTGYVVTQGVKIVNNNLTIFNKRLIWSTSVHFSTFLYSIIYILLDFDILSRGIHDIFRKRKKLCITVVMIRYNVRDGHCFLSGIG